MPTAPRCRRAPRLGSRRGSRAARGAGVVFIAVALIAGAACSSSGSSGTDVASTAKPRFSPPPTGLPEFYAVPNPVPDGPPGTLLKSQRFTDPTVDGTVYRVMYLSRSVHNRPAPATGLVLVPNGPAPSGGFPVVTFAHGTNGLGDECAPSLAPIAGAPSSLLDRGWVVTETDYQGEGSPGVMPYLAGVSAAHDTIDIVRAARHLSAAHASSDYVVQGPSEGGQTAMFALHVAPSYAPELHLKGVIAVAAPAQLEVLYAHLKDSKYRYYLLMIMVGLNAAYGDRAAPLDEVLSPAGLALVPEISSLCVSLPRYGFAQPVKQLLPYKLRAVTIEDTFKADPFALPTWRQVLMDNDPLNFTTATDAPLLMVQGGADEQIPPSTNVALAKHLCALGQDLERWVYPGQSHALVIAASGDDVIRWIADRFRGVSDPDRYVPHEQSDVEHSRCPA